MSDYNIEIRPYLPQSLATVTQMAPAINAVAAQYNLDPRAIAGAIALEQNNLQQFYFPRYMLGNIGSSALLGLADPNARWSSDEIYNAAQQARANTPDPTPLDRVSNPTNFDIGPARIRVSLAVDLVANARADDAVLSRYQGHYDDLIQDMAAGRPDVTAALVGAYLQRGADYFRTHMGPANDPTDGAAAWDALPPERQNALLDQYYNQGTRAFDRTFAEARETGDPWVPQTLGDGGALYAYPGNAARLEAALAGMVPGTSSPTPSDRDFENLYETSANTLTDGSVEIVALNRAVANGQLARESDPLQIDSITRPDGTVRVTSRFQDGSSRESELAPNGDLSPQGIITRNAAGQITSRVTATDEGGAILTNYENGRAVSQSYSDGNGNLLRTEQYADDGSATVSIYGRSGNVSAVQEVNAAGIMTSQRFVDETGATIAQQAYDPQTGQPIDFTANGQTRGMDGLAGSLGSTIGNFLGGNSLVERVGLSTAMARSLRASARYSINPGLSELRPQLSARRAGRCSTMLLPTQPRLTRNSAPGTSPPSAGAATRLPAACLHS